MARFIRKNELVFTGTFTLADGTLGVPTAAYLVLSYTNNLGQPTKTTIGMTSTLGVWSAVWDTSDCRDGNVDWLVYSTGSLIAADEGSFDIYANSANVGN
jgi:hypothetical protein